MLCPRRTGATLGVNKLRLLAVILFLIGLSAPAYSLTEYAIRYFQDQMNVEKAVQSFFVPERGINTIALQPASSDEIHLYIADNIKFDDRLISGFITAHYFISASPRFKYRSSFNDKKSIVYKNKHRPSEVNIKINHKLKNGVFVSFVDINEDKYLKILDNKHCNIYVNFVDGDIKSVYNKIKTNVEEFITRCVISSYLASYGVFRYPEIFDSEVGIGFSTYLMDLLYGNRAEEPVVLKGMTEQQARRAINAKVKENSRD